jgi:hypothetical protein
MSWVLHQELDKLPLRSFILGQRTGFISANSVTDPSVSTAGSFRTSALLLLIV